MHFWMNGQAVLASNAFCWRGLNYSIVCSSVKEKCHLQCRCVTCKTFSRFPQSPIFVSLNAALVPNNFHLPSEIPQKLGRRYFFQPERGIFLNTLPPISKRNLTLKVL